MGEQATAEPTPHRTDGPLVSAILATYNRAAHVGGAIDSVLAQTYDDIEVVVVDDGSTDATPTVLDDYAADDRVRVLRNEENRGIPRTRNRGLEAARGEYVAIIDDDDRWHPRKTAKQVGVLEGLPDDYCGVYADGIITDADGDLVETVRTHAAGDIYPEILLEMPVLPHASQLLRRDCVEAVGGFDPAFDIASDWELAIRLADRWQYACIPEVLVARTHHGDNVTGDPAYDVRAREMIREKHGDRVTSSGIDDAFTAAEHREHGLLALTDGARLEAVKRFLAASYHDPTPDHLALAAVAPTGQSGLARARQLRDRLTGAGESATGPAVALDDE